MRMPELVSRAAEVLEFVGVATILLAGVVAAVRGVRGGRAGLFRRFRRDLGLGILLGLEFLVGADIIRTVSAKPTLDDVLVLGAIVLVRTFLSFTLEVELDGQWPWRRGRAKPEDPEGPSPR